MGLEQILAEAKRNLEEHPAGGERLPDMEKAVEVSPEEQQRKDSAEFPQQIKIQDDSKSKTKEATFEIIEEKKKNSRDDSNISKDPKQALMALGYNLESFRECEAEDDKAERQNVVRQLVIPEPEEPVEDPKKRSDIDSITRKKEGLDTHKESSMKKKKKDIDDIEGTDDLV